MSRVQDFVSAVLEVTVLKWIERREIKIRKIRETSLMRAESRLEGEGYTWIRDYSNHSWDILRAKILKLEGSKDLTCLAYYPGNDETEKLIISLFGKDKDSESHDL